MIDTLYCSPFGNDGHSGLKPDPPQEGWHGPLATLAGALKRLREYKRDGKLATSVTVYLRGGRYHLEKPLELTPADSWPMTFAAWKDELPLITGSVRITGWKESKCENGLICWEADLPEVREGKWYFKSLFVNGRRASRAVFPVDGYLKIADVPGCAKTDFLWHGSDRFMTVPGDLSTFENLQDIDVLIPHFWVEERLPIASWDEESRLLISSRKSTGKLTLGWESDWASYQLENVFEALCKPGQWYSNRRTGKVYYLPLPSEKLEEMQAFAPKACQLILLNGDPEKEKFVEHIGFRGLHFTETDWQQPNGPGFDVNYIDPSWKYGTDVQGAATVRGVIEAKGARYITIESCTFSLLGEYAINLLTACNGFKIIGNHLHDLGAGGIKVHGANTSQAPILRSDRHWITDNHIHAIGKIFKSGIGVLLMHSAHNRIAHNRIHDTHYSAISVGWVWGFADSNTSHNVIEYNHLYDLGKAVLADLGAVYTLGVQPGTTIRNNLIHDVRASDYGAWGIYPDEGSSHIVIENNIVYGTQSACFHQHFGRENIVRNNIFAFGGEGVIMLSRHDNDRRSLTVLNNIMVSQNQPAHHGGHSNKMDGTYYFSDLNVLWDVAASDGHGGEPAGARKAKWHGGTTISLPDLRQLGYDQHSIVTDPCFNDIDRNDFSLRPESPAFGLGFQPIDLSKVGPRTADCRDNVPQPI